jgi:thioesterase domain-containing protein/acyl carrier protein
LKAHLGTRLPSYMVPQQFVVLPALPLSPNGKVDRTALLRLASAPAVAQPGENVAPRTQLEADLVQIWQQVLGQPRIGIRDDFFDLGGQSFAAIQVMTRIEQRYGRRLPLGELLRGRTVERLARHIEEATAASPLVRMNQVDSGVPLFLVHPAGGNVLCYRDLAQRLRRPVFGLQAPALTAERHEFQSLSQLAALYVRAVRELQPHGPYHFGGWSSGGLVAFEMCRQIEESGSDVERLTMIDAPSPWNAGPVDDATLMRWFLQDLNSGRDLAELGAELAYAPALSDGLALLNKHRRATARLAPEDIDPVWRFFRDMLKASSTYTPGCVRSSIHVIKACEMSVEEFIGHPAEGTPDWGWSGFTSGEVRSTPVAGNHYTMWDAVRVERLAALLNGLEWSFE